MGVREIVNQQKPIAMGAGILLFVTAVALAVSSLRTNTSTQAQGPMQAYFSTDDGKSYFVADQSNIAPFDHKGKQAVRAYVFKCPDGKPFVAYLEQYTAEGRVAVEAIRKGGPPPVALVMKANMAGREVKRPGEEKWTRCDNLAAAGAVSTAKPCSDGSRPEPVDP
jgi:hypothetical protein